MLEFKAILRKTGRNQRKKPFARRPDPQFLMKSGEKAVSRDPDPPPLAI